MSLESYKKKYKTNTILKFKSNINSLNISLLTNKNLFNFLKNNIFNYTRSDSELYKITLKNKIKIKINDWCFIY